jgi:hypothetical protein
VSKCRSCGAEIKWVVMSGGKRMPLDAEPCDDGNVVEGDDGRYAVAVSIRKSDRPRYKSHFATCPNASGHRKPKE